MSNKVTAKELTLKGSYTANVKGNFNLDKVTVYDDFTGADISAVWTQSDDNGGTVAIGGGAGGTVTLTTGGSDDDRAIITGSLHGEKY